MGMTRDVQSSFLDTCTIPCILSQNSLHAQCNIPENNQTTGDVRVSDQSKDTETDVKKEEEDPNITAAITAFKEWSNYLLITTVASLGWVASKNAPFTSGNIRTACIYTLGLSIVFGIFTLALVPLLAQQAPGKLAQAPNTPEEERSIYKVPVTFSLFRRRYFTKTGIYLTQACRPQHILFLVGIVTYCLGTVDGGAGGPSLPSGLFNSAVIGGIIVLLTAPVAYFSKPK